MKPWRSIQQADDDTAMRDMFIILTPVVLTLVAILWFFWDELLPSH
jgi:hypothetical protein